MTTNLRPGPEISSLAAFRSAIYLFDKTCHFVPKPGTKHFVPVSCKRLRKFHTGKTSYRSEFVTVSCTYSLSLYRAGEEKPIERYKTRVKVVEENKLFSSFQKNIIEFLGLNKQAQKFGLKSFDLKFYRLTKITSKAENYAISTQQQLELELPSCLAQMGKAS